VKSILMWRALIIGALLLMLPVVAVQAWLDSYRTSRWQLSVVVGTLPVNADGSPHTRLEMRYYGLRALATIYPSRATTLSFMLQHDPEASPSMLHSAWPQPGLTAAIHLMERSVAAWVTSAISASGCRCACCSCSAND
jgi:hypothetical protein